MGYVRLRFLCLWLIVSKQRKCVLKIRQFLRVKINIWLNEKSRDNHLIFLTYRISV